MDATPPIHSPKLLAAATRFALHLADRLQADIALRLWDGSVVPLGPHATGDLAIAIRTPTAITRLLRRPRLATLVDLLAAGDIDIEGGTLLDLAARRGTASRGLFRRLSKPLLARTLLPFLLASTRTTLRHAYDGAADRAATRDDKALVQFHYDLSNAFYALFLDPELQYSCAYFPDPALDIASAQQAKLDMICRKLRMHPGDRFLDIGCGWGGLVCHAAQHFGVHAHGVTLSQAQFDFAQAKIDRLGLRDRVTVELKDYRELTGEYDRVASIGMFEHVPWDDHATYFQKMRGLLRPKGVMLHHAITRPAKGTLKAFRRKRAEYAAIVNYIFPGSELDHIGHTVSTMEANGFEVHDVEAWREHYAQTTKLWCQRLYENRAAAEQEVGSAKTRLWLLYLAGVSLGFDRGGIGIFQTVATRRSRGASQMPPSRGDLYGGGGAVEQAARG
jgi:cyclopropane-fatty-acyl-phospholipid synthase